MPPAEVKASAPSAQYSPGPRKARAGRDAPADSKGTKLRDLIVSHLPLYLENLAAAMEAAKACGWHPGGLVLFASELHEDMLVFKRTWDAPCCEIPRRL